MGMHRLRMPAGLCVRVAGQVLQLFLVLELLQQLQLFELPELLLLPAVGCRLPAAGCRLLPAFCFRLQ